MGQDDRYSCLDSFRGFAILWIVCFHILYYFKDEYGNVVNFLVEKGELGVEFFFVISGFAISKSVHKILSDDGSAVDFIKKRLRRIYRPYIFSLVFEAFIFAPVFAFFIAFKGYDLPFLPYKYSLNEWLKIITLTKVFSSSSWDLSVVFRPLNDIVWFMAVIVQIYLVMFFAMFTKRHYYKIISLITFLSLLTFIAPVKNLIPYGLFLPFWSRFSVGILLFHLIRSGNIYKKKLFKNEAYYLPAVASLFILILVITYFLQGIVPADLYSFCFCLNIGLLFWFIYPSDNILIKTRLFRILKVFGSFSFSLYLIHKPLGKLLLLFLADLAPIPLVIVFAFFLIPLILFFSYLWYLFFERPGSVSNTVSALIKPIKTLKDAKVKINNS